MSYDTIEERIAKKAVAQLKQDIDNAFGPVLRFINMAPKSIMIDKDTYASVMINKIMESTTVAYHEKYINNARKAFLETVDRLAQEVDDLRSEMSE